MRNLLTISFLLISAMAIAQKQPGWCITFNNKILLKGYEGNEQLLIKMKASDLAQHPQAKFTITYTDAGADKSWQRTFYINNAADESVATLQLQQPTGKVFFTADKIAGYAQQQQTVFIYTTSLPRNPEKAAAIRVRRVLLCSIAWE